MGVIKVFFLSKKKFKRKNWFLFEKRYICQNKVAFAKIMTQIFDPKKLSKDLETEFSDLGKLNARRALSVKADFCVVGFLCKSRKKLKIATSTEAPIMVKSDF